MTKGRACMLVAYTCVGQMSKGRAYKLVAYTCGGQMSKGHAYTLVAYTWGGQMSKGHAYTPVAYTCAGDKCLRDILKCCSHAPALGEFLKGAPTRWSQGRIHLRWANV